MPIQDAIRPAAVVARQDRLQQAFFFFDPLSNKGFNGLRFFGGGAFAVALVDMASKVAPNKSKKALFAYAI
jgi:hypothetical protein